ncbi:hypothetical protein BTN49_1216 [Candidatus Enterovibrio escicola]|uniref:Uncharacterized protein n=1 Tax=Candidatus Enterovibrio escicola TaxID=1927127 RepID=A0A2A5T525_9GAMM|nr:hypothetical protein BTN49_1216 [Candidatus Enterovibrio escacola]
MWNIKDVILAFMAIKRVVSGSGNMIDFISRTFRTLTVMSPNLVCRYRTGK